MRIHTVTKHRAPESLSFVPHESCSWAGEYALQERQEYRAQFWFVWFENRVCIHCG